MSYGQCFICYRKAELNWQHYCSACQVSRSVTKAAKEAASRNNTTTTTTRYVPVDNTPWWETGWVWFWLIVFPIVGVYGLFKRYPKGMWYFIGFAIVIRLFQLLFEWVKGLFS